MEQASSMAYDINMPMPFGQYKMKKIRELPVAYLRSVVQSVKRGQRLDFVQWLGSKLDEIELIQQQPTEPIIELPPPGSCMKAIFVDEKAANKRLIQIQRDGQERKSTPIRTYYCEICGGWHLTSQEQKYNANQHTKKPSNQ